MLLISGVFDIKLLEDHSNFIDVVRIDTAPNKHNYYYKEDFKHVLSGHISIAYSHGSHDTPIISIDITNYRGSVYDALIIIASLKPTCITILHGNLSDEMENAGIDVGPCVYKLII